MSAPSGNTFASNTNVSAPVFSEMVQLCSLIEDIAGKWSNGVHGFSNTEIANYMAALVYTGANNYGNSTFTPSPSRVATRGITWQGNTIIQQIVNCVQTVAFANS